MIRKLRRWLHRQNIAAAQERLREAQEELVDAQRKVADANVGLRKVRGA